MFFTKKMFKGGAKVPHCKNTDCCETYKIGVPEKIILPMQQHIGAPCAPIVKKGDTIKVGQVVGISDKYVSASIHSSVSGVVSDVALMPYAGGPSIMSVEIKTDGKQELYEGIRPPMFSNRKEFIDAIAASGLVGLGGAGFPAHVKLSPPPDKNIDTLIVNGAECEPYITSDYREILENSWGVISGVNILLDMLEVKRVLIGIEDNKPEAIDVLTRIAEKDNRITVVKLKSRYPQGAEKMLIYAMTGRKVPTGKLPADVGVIVMNINSVSFIAEYVKTGMPLVKKRVTVDGSAVAKPANVEVLIGTPLADVFDACGGFKSEPRKILMGGPMMGIAQYSLQTSVLKNTNALLAFDDKDSIIPKESPCIRCGKCVKACPMNLLPLYLNLHTALKNTDELVKFNVNDCIECGSCCYVCPAGRQLVQSIRLGKSILRQKTAKGVN